MNSLKWLDALCLAIFIFEGGAKPTSRNVRNNNPGNLRPWAESQTVDGDGYRIFTDFFYGWQALQSDVLLKGHRFIDGTLLELFEEYAPGADHNDPHGYAQFVCKWLSVALRRDITLATTLRELAA